MRIGILNHVNILRAVAPLLVSLSVTAGMMGCRQEAPILEEGKITLALSSTVFQNGEAIPAKYTCDGQNISPPLSWGEPPQKTQSFALIMDDPDALGGVFTHWVLFNLPSDNCELQEAILAQAQLPNGALQGKNGFRKIGYGGPCPPPGHFHRYRFTIYALDQTLDLKAGVSKKQVMNAIERHILGRGQLTGTYRR